MKQPPGVKALAFNLAYNGRANVLKSEVHISSAYAPPLHPNINDLKKYLAIWDTGATNSVITQKVVQECALQPISVTKVNTVNGERLSNVYLAGVWLPNKVAVPKVRVTEGIISGDAEVLIGMDIICMGDFAITNKDNKTNFSFRLPSLECLDFVKQIQSQTLPTVARNALCPCGSGKKYKRCHGSN